MSSDTDCGNPSVAATIAAALKLEPVKQLASGQGMIKAEPVDDDTDNNGTGDVFHQFPSADSKEGKVDFICDFSYEPGSSADLSCSPGPSDAVKPEDSEPTFLNSLPEETGRLQPSVDLSIPVNTCGAQQSTNTSCGAQQPRNTSYQCQRCPAVFMLFSFLKQHMASIHGERLSDVSSVWSPPQGSVAGNVNIEKKNGDKNMNIEKKDGDRKTMEKEKGIADSNEIDRTTEKDRKRHVCDVCNKAFNWVSHLQQHKMIHTGVKQFVCDMCDKAFTHANNLKKHKLIHTGQKRYVCDVCNKAFTQARDMNRHKLTHTGHKQFVCDVCNKAFNQDSNLKRHKWIHIGLKQFVCDVCNRAFTQADHLKTHKLTNHMHKNFVCDVCSKAFTDAGSLMTHKMIHPGLQD